MCRKKRESKGDLQRTHGGAVRKEEPLELSVRLGNIYIKVEEKVRIGKRAYAYIADKEMTLLLAIIWQRKSEKMAGGGKAG